MEMVPQKFNLNGYFCLPTTPMAVRICSEIMERLRDARRFGSLAALGCPIEQLGDCLASIDERSLSAMPRVLPCD